MATDPKTHDEATESDRPGEVSTADLGLVKPDPARTKLKRARPSKAAAEASKTGSKPQAAKASKTDLVLKKLKSAKGVTLGAMMEATGWQAHSVRGFLSAMVRKKLGLNLVSDVGKDGARRYRVDESSGSGTAS